MYIGELKGLYVLLSRTQAGPGRAIKQEQKENSRNHVQTIFLDCVLNEKFISNGGLSRIWLHYRVPKNRAAQWAAALKLTMPLKESTRVCSKHFKCEDIGYSKDGSRRMLKPTAIPIPLEGVDESDLSFSRPEGRRNHCIVCGTASTEKGISYHR